MKTARQGRVRRWGLEPGSYQIPVACHPLHVVVCAESNRALHGIPDLSCMQGEGSARFMWA